MRLKFTWQGLDIEHNSPKKTAENLLGEDAKNFDLYDHYQLIGLYQVCKESKSMAEAGRRLFNVTRLNKKSSNDSHRLKQILTKYGLDFEALSKSE